MNHSISNNRPKNLTGLCDHVLFKIFSYLNLDDGIRLPLVCMRFRCFIQQNKLPMSATSSMDMLRLWTKRHFSYNRVFQKLGSNLKTLTINSNEDEFEMDLIMKSIGIYCQNIKTMVVHFLYANTVSRLPKSLRNLTVGDFRANCLNVSALTHLEKLSLTSSDELDEVKVYRPLKEFHLDLRLGHNMPDHAKINRLTTMVGEKFEVELHSNFSDAMYYYGDRIHRVALNDLNRIMNLKVFTMHFYFATIQGINTKNVSDSQMLCKCGHRAPVPKNTLHRILNDYLGPDWNPATKVVRYTPGANLITIQFEFDDYEHRNMYFDRLHLSLPICHCAFVDVRILLE